MSLRRFEKVILSLVSLLVLAVIASGLYLFVFKADNEDEGSGQLRLKPLGLAEDESAKTVEVSDQKEDEQEIQLPGPLTLPAAQRNKPVVASVDLSELWAETGFRGFAGLSEEPVLEAVEIEYTEYKVPLQFQTLELPSAELYEGETVVHQQGREGELVVTTRNVYRGGTLLESSEVSSLIKVEQVNEIIYYGTKTDGSSEQALLEAEAIAESESLAQAEAERLEAEAQAAADAAESEAEAVEEEVASPPESEESAEVVVDPAPVGDLVQFVAASGDASSINQNLDILRANGILGSAGRQTLYTSFEDHGTYITVNGVNVPYSSKVAKTTTSYDGLLCCIQGKCHNPPINHNTASGVPANIGLCASNEYPFGTVLFVEGYGFCIVADRHGTPQHPDLVDVCYAPGEVENFNFGLASRNVYLISMP
ncbi:MAG: G5 domain-containing protein [Eubacteriales bacterium]|nr:G5 domain-containing protein [Eubacteriales bacterium]